jgi:hypothetical protein
VEAGAPVTVRLTRASASHGGPPQWLGVEVDDDDQARSWQTSGGTVGRFSRALLPKERTALRRAITAAKKAVAEGGQPNATDRVWKPEGSTEQLSADGLPALELDPHEDPPKGFGSLLRVLRTLLGDLVDSPVAAIALEVDGTPPRARLRHVGPEAVDVRLGSLSVEAHLFDEGDAIVDSAALRVDGPAQAAEVGSGWSFGLSDNLGIAAPTKGQFLVVSVELELDANGDGVLRRARLSRIIE